MSLIPQFGFLELLLVGMIALIVVGPKDLPRLMRSAGQFFAKARAMASEFTAAFDQMARESEMEELRKEIDTLKKENVFAQTKAQLEGDLAPVEKALREEATEIQDAATKPVAPAPSSENAEKKEGAA